MAYDFVKCGSILRDISERFHIFAKITTFLNSREMNNDEIIRI